MAYSVATAEGTTTTANEDITSTMKSATLLGSDDNLAIRKFSFISDIATKLYINDGTATSYVSVLEDAVGSGRYVFSLNTEDVITKQIIVADAACTYAITFLY